MMDVLFQSIIYWTWTKDTEQGGWDGTDSAAWQVPSFRLGWGTISSILGFMCNFQLPSKSCPIHYSPNFIPFDATYSGPVYWHSFPSLWIINRLTIMPLHNYTTYIQFCMWLWGNFLLFRGITNFLCYIQVKTVNVCPFVTDTHFHSSPPPPLAILSFYVIISKCSFWFCLLSVSGELSNMCLLTPDHGRMFLSASWWNSLQ